MNKVVIVLMCLVSVGFAQATFYNEDFDMMISSDEKGVYLQYSGWGWGDGLNPNPPALITMNTGSSTLMFSNSVFDPQRFELVGGLYRFRFYSKKDLAKIISTKQQLEITVTLKSGLVDVECVLTRQNESNTTTTEAGN